jgi:phosphate/sulfate permease
MFEKLKSKWKVNGWNLFLILTTFAVGGSICGRVGKKLLDLLSVEKGFLWVMLYILMVTILWPFAVILVSIPLGQFAFFKKYLQKVFTRLTGGKK